MWGVAGHVVLVAERCSGSQVLRLCFILSLSAGVETSEKALKGDNPDKAARPRPCGASSLRALECHAFVYLRPGSCPPTVYLCFLHGSACHWHLINVKK